MLLVVCALFGGASRADAPQQLVVWLAAIAVGVGTATFAPATLRESRQELLFLAGALIVVLAQLIPTPYGWWAQLSGREIYARALEAASIPQVPRPLNLTPALGWTAALSLLPCAATVLALQFRGPGRQRAVLVMLVLIVLASATLGAVQASRGSSLAFKLYTISTLDAPVGLFANRNHHALLLAMGLPMLAATAVLTAARIRKSRILFAAMTGLAVLLIISIAFTGSRAGLLLGLLGLFGASVLLAGARGPGVAKVGARAGWRRPTMVLGTVLCLALLIWLSVSSPTVARLLNQSFADDSRVASTQVLVGMFLDQFPFGAGFGSFSGVYRSYEPVTLLSLDYLNQAHNDVLQLAIEGGAAALALLGVFLAWAFVAAFRAWRNDRTRTSVVLARLGSIMLGQILLASLVDYPLRTPLVAVMLVVASFWLKAASAKGLYRSPLEP